MIQFIDAFLIALMTYIGVGVLFGIYFVLAGAKKLDPGVDETPWHFKIIIFPGSILLWSVLLIKIIKQK